MFRRADAAVDAAANRSPFDDIGQISENELIHSLSLPVASSYRGFFQPPPQYCVKALMMERGGRHTKSARRRHVMSVASPRPPAGWGRGARAMEAEVAAWPANQCPGIGIAPMAVSVLG